MDTRNRNIFHQRIWLFALLIILLGFISIFTNTVIQSHDEKLARAAIDSENMARVLDEHVNGIIQKTGILLDHIADEAMPKPGEKARTPEELSAYLKKLKTSLPEVLSIRIVKSDGHNLADSKEGKLALYYGDRAYFIRHRDNPSLGLDISEPIVGRTNHVWEIIVSRRLNNADGSFAGIVSSAIALSYFEDLFSSLNLGKSSNITLLSKNLYVVTRFPISEGLRMKSLRGALIETALRKNPHEGRFSGKSKVDGVDRVYSYRQVGNLPLIVVVGLSKQDVLAEWRHNAWIDGAVITGLILAIVLLTHNLLQRHRHEQESETRLREITANLGEGVYALDRNGIVTFVNPETEKLLGWAAKDLVGKDGHSTFHYKTPDGTPISSDECPVHKTIRTGQVFRSLNDWLIRKDGTVIPVSIVSSPIIQKGGITGSVAAFQDITQRLEAEKALHESEERFRLISASANDAIVIVGPAQDITYWNPAAVTIFGHEANEAVGKNLHELLAPRRHRDNALRGFDHFRLSGEGPLIGKTFETGALRKNGEEFPIELSISAFRIKGQWQALGIIRDISERKKTEERIHQLAYYDTLTNLPNRRLMLSRLEQALAQAKRYQRSLAIMFLDLDKFKIINDTLGHDIGDELLKVVATRLSTCVRSGDTVSRHGGDEFIIVLAEIAHPQDAALVAEKIINALKEPIPIRDHPLQITTSIGIAVFPTNAADDDLELMKKADIAMYSAKEAGRNRYCFY